MRKIRAVLFDMDGLLLDTEKLNIECVCLVAREMGAELQPEVVARRIMGTARAQIVAAYQSLLPDSVDGAAFYQRKNELFAKRKQQEGVKPMKGAVELLHWLHEKGIACVLVTATVGEAARERLRENGMWDLLPYRVTGDMPLPSKPDPAPYLKGAELAGVDPAECLVLEDSFNGIRSGRAAGCMVGMVPDTLPYDETCRPYCDAVFRDLTEVQAWMEE
ncbi:MAG: HAD family phosphatase [Clostridia bacterium]|nr:HAD family phosphatase [Clostridia bacterium]